ncbi:alanine dehydrogenase [Gammaproteobacteria bacterium]|nr:alanine dehydrogenase [Gammaproteobacteria bacterium]
MKIGVPKEIKNNEHRVGLIPSSVSLLSQSNHIVFVEENAGADIGFSNEDYLNAGAQILRTAEEVFNSSELIIKVKEPMQDELKYLNSSHTLFTYLHLAGDKQQAAQLTKTGVRGIAYETVTSADGSLPLLAPMSAIAGQLSLVVGSYHLLKPNKGIGTLIGSFGDIEPRVVTVIGAGVAGTEAIEKAIAANAHVKIIDLSSEKLLALKSIYGTHNIEYIESTEASIAEALSVSDLVIGAVYVVGKEAPKVVTEAMLDRMTPGSVLVDISIDQGGCFETSQPTNHDEPTYVKKGVVHYCVTNMPGAVPLTATHALNKATLPFILDLANKGIDRALKEDEHLLNGLNIQDGIVMHPAVKEALSG